MAGAGVSAAARGGRADGHLDAGQRKHARGPYFRPRTLGRTYRGGCMNLVTDSRQEAMTVFLAESGWATAELKPLPGDASTRRYVRLHLGGRTAMLMDQPQNAEAPTAGPDATPEARRALGYNAMARLSGADCGRFVATAQYLKGCGLAAPEVLAADV